MSRDLPAGCTQAMIDDEYDSRDLCECGSGFPADDCEYCQEVAEQEDALEEMIYNPLGVRL